MFRTFVDSLNSIETKIEGVSPEEIPALFKDIPDEVFALLTLNIRGQIPDLGSISQRVVNNQEPLRLLPYHPWPAIAAFLPTMPDHIHQKKWNGAFGINLLLKSLATYNSFSHHFFRLTGKTLEHCNILDYGCGWGRMLRLFYKSTPYTRLYGADPWDISVDACKKHNLKCNLGISQWVPDSLPFGDTVFDFVYSFSVFTHISFRSANAAMQTIRKRIDKNGLLAITIRPVEYWKLHQRGRDKNLDADAATEEFERNGFSFVPHPAKSQFGNFDYGDTVMSVDFIRKTWPEWEVVHVDLNLIDPYQLLVFLRPV